jgi:hypothetical protein
MEELEIGAQEGCTGDTCFLKLSRECRGFFVGSAKVPSPYPKSSSPGPWGLEVVPCLTALSTAPLQDTTAAAVGDDTFHPKVGVTYAAKLSYSLAANADFPYAYLEKY